MGRRRTTHKDFPRHLHLKGRMYYYVTGGANGKRQWIRLSGNYGEALRAWAELEGARPPTGQTVSAAIDRFLQEAVTKLRPATVKEYVRQAPRLKTVFGHLRVDSLRSSDIAEYLDIHPSPISANREIGLLSSILTRAVRWGWAEKNPCRGVERNPENGRDRYITDEELKKLIDKADPMIGCIVEFAYITGLRKSDVLRIRRDQISAAGIAVRISKLKDKTQLFEWNKSLRRVVRRALKIERPPSSVHLFPNRKGKAYTTSGLDSLWQRLRAKAGVADVRFHDIRGKAGSDSDDASALLGHSDPRVTKRYKRKPIPVSPLNWKGSKKKAERRN